MPPPDNPPPQESLYDPKKSILLVLAGIESLAGAHRVAHYRFGTPGARAIDRWTWIGIGLVYPFFVCRWPPANRLQNLHAYRLWQGLLVLAFLHSGVAFWSRRVRHSRTVGRARWGRLEALVSLAAAWVAGLLAGPGAGYFLAAAYAANIVQLALIQARCRRMVALRRDALIEAAEFSR